MRRGCDWEAWEMSMRHQGESGWMVERMVAGRCQLLEAAAVVGRPKVRQEASGAVRQRLIKLRGIMGTMRVWLARETGMLNVWGAVRQQIPCWLWVCRDWRGDVGMRGVIGAAAVSTCGHQ